MPDVVLSVTEIGMGKRRGSDDDKFDASFTRKFRVRMDDQTADMTNVLNATDPSTGLTIPPRWAPHPGDPLALVKSRSCDEEETPDRWIVTVEYSRQATDQTRQAQNPLDEPPDFDVSTEEFEDALLEDLDGNAIVNAAFDPFETPPTQKKYRLIIKVTQNEEFLDIEDFATYQGHVNLTDFLVFYAGQVLLRSIEPKRDYRNGQSFFRKLYTFVVAPLDGETDPAKIADIWQTKLLNHGQWCLNGENTRYVRIVDDQGRPLQQGGLLDEDGHQLVRGQPAVFLRFQTIPRAEFNDLGIDLDF